VTAAPLIFRHEAMATWFEVRVAGEEAKYARQAAQAAFAVADRIEEKLSRYREESEIARIRLLAEGESLRVSRETLECLLTAMEISALTGGAFHPALGAAMDRLRDEAAPWLPDDSSAEPGRLEIDRDALVVTRSGGRVDLDLGGIGKGFALDQMAVELAEWEVSRALLVAGGSSILALDAPAGERGWKVRINETHAIFLRHRSIGTSGLAVKGAHIIDPRHGEAAEVAGRAWAVARRAAWSDALSTAFLLLPWPEVGTICRGTPEVSALRSAGGAAGPLLATELAGELGFHPLEAGDPD
jgi:FAD:protein FMN transferase